MKQLIKNGKIYNGTENEPFMGEILIEDDKIAGIYNYAESKGYDGEDVDKVYDIDGLSVSPGFIDMHSHNDWFAIKKEPLPYFEPFIKQGITTFIAGNCGLSAVGFDKGTAHVDISTTPDLSSSLYHTFHKKYTAESSAVLFYAFSFMALLSLGFASGFRDWIAPCLSVP